MPKGSGNYLILDKTHMKLFSNFMHHLDWKWSSGWLECWEGLLFFLWLPSKVTIESSQALCWLSLRVEKNIFFVFYNGVKQCLIYFSKLPHHKRYLNVYKRILWGCARVFGRVLCGPVNYYNISNFISVVSPLSREYFIRHFTGLVTTYLSCLGFTYGGH